MIQVLLTRPERRFGYAVTFYRDDPITGKKEVLHFTEEGDRWDQLESKHAEVRPTFIVDDSALEALMAAYLELKPQPQPDPDVPAVLMVHLDDTRDVRDRLLAIVETFSKPTYLTPIAAQLQGEERQ